MHPNPAQRFQSMDAFIEALEPFERPHAFVDPREAARRAQAPRQKERAARLAQRNAPQGRERFKLSAETRI
jgi:hypothetical protein